MIPWASVQLLAVPLLPLLPFIVLSIGGAGLGRSVAWVLIGCTAVVLGISAELLHTVLSTGGMVSASLDWLNLTGGLVADFRLKADSLSAAFVCLILVISLAVQFFSLWYMAEDAEAERYWGRLSLFTSAMLGLVLGANLLIVFVFWELVGLGSFLLIGFWSWKPEAGLAARNAFVLNRIGDAAFVSGLLCLYSSTHTLDLDVIASLRGQSILQEPVFQWGCVLVGLGGWAKSAQGPFALWLPQAMAGPTTGSALIHAATMVAAGVYLHIRLIDFFPPLYLQCLIVVGLTTALASGLAALVSFDFKQILAFSTLSQLGILFLAIGLGSPDVAWFHLFTHAFFKAGLFLVAGFWIHHAEHATHHHTQDIRKLGAPFRAVGMVGGVLVLCMAALVGLPFSAGYYSKELILELSLHHPAIGLATLIASFLTAAYTVRLASWLLLETNQPQLPYFRSSATTGIPLVFLGICSIGWCGFWDHGATILGLARTNGQVVATHISTNTLLLGMATLLLGAVAGWLVYTREHRKTGEARISPFILEPFGLSVLYARLLKPVIQSVTIVVEWLDRKVIDAVVTGCARLLAGDAVGSPFSGLAPVLAQVDADGVDAVPTTVATLPWWIGYLFRRTHLGNIQYYLLLSTGLVGVLILVLYLIL
jgi:NADH-quinone oxidoreductase subunit L